MRIIKMAEVLGAARDFGGDGLSFDNWDKVPEAFIDDAISAPILSGSELPEKPKGVESPAPKARKPLRSGGTFKRL